MNDIIKVNYNTDQPTVSARDQSGRSCSGMAARGKGPQGQGKAGEAEQEGSVRYGVQCPVPGRGCADGARPCGVLRAAGGRRCTRSVGQDSVSLDSGIRLRT